MSQEAIRETNRVFEEEVVGRRNFGALERVYTRDARGGERARPRLGGVAAMPWWGWLGGFAGATYVVTVFTALPAIGAAAAVGFTVAGQQAASVLVDRFGWFRLPRRPVSALRLAGVAVLLAGVATIKAL